MSVQSVRKAVDILLAVAGNDGPVTLTEAAAKSGIPIATARRLLGTLVDTSLVRREGKGYSLGVRAYEIGKKAEAALSFGGSRAYLRRLADRTGENANLAILDGTDVVYLVCEECSKVVRAFTVQGARVPAHATGVGKVLLSGLTGAEIEALYRGKSLESFTPRTMVTLETILAEARQARELGYAMDEGEREEGVLCVAAPVRDYWGRVVAAVSVSGPSARLGKARAECRRLTLECAADISKNLGWDGLRKQK